MRGWLRPATPDVAIPRLAAPTLAILSLGVTVLLPAIRAAVAAPTGNAPFCLKTASGQLNCSFPTMGQCEQARGGSDQCITRSDAGGTTGLGDKPALPPGASVEPAPVER